MPRIAILLLAVAVLPAVLSAQNPQPHAGAHIAASTTAPASALPIRRVALYKNGVGLFEHAGEVHGTERVAIDFTTARLNDVLQTLTAIDLRGGRITGAGYNSTTPVDQQLGSLPLALDADAGAADFYAAIRGARVEVTGAGPAVTGRILNVEVREADSGKDGHAVESRHFLTVISDTGTVRTVELSGNTGVRLLDAALHTDVNRYLEILSDNHRQGLRHLALTDSGSGSRELRVSYLSEVPVWKSTYRILFEVAGTGPKQATLQGWAVVDNTLGVDWKNVQLSLIAGAPQSFVQPISQPYYTRRPVLGLPEESQLTPQTHEGGEPTPPQRIVASLDLPASSAPRQTAGVAGSGMGVAGGVMGGLGLSSAPTPVLNGMAGGNAAGGTYTVHGRQFDPLQTVTPVSYEDSAAASVAANTSTSGFDDFFEYKLTDPVTILKNQSALVPILQTKIEVDPVTLYPVHSGQALRALWLRNTSTLTLDRGSFSIFE